MFAAARFFFFIFLFSIFSLLSSVPVFAQNINQYATPNIAPDVPQNLNTYTQNVVIEVMSAALCQLVGVNPSSQDQKCLGVDQKTGQIGFVENGGGAVGAMGHMIAIMYTPPLHVGDYTSYLAQNFGVTKSAYAANPVTGFDSLKPLLNLWTVFRNIVYLLFVVLFVIVGIAVMLRIQIDPHTVMSVENQIPKIIIGLVMVTFSYAIAGFIVDFMWTATYLTTNILTQAVPGAVDEKALPTNFNTPPMGFINAVIKDPNGSEGGFFDIVTRSAGSIKDIIQAMFAPTLDNNNFELGDKRGCGIGDIGCIAGEAISGAIGWLLGWLFGALALLVISIALLYAMFKLWFQLIAAYIFFLLDVIFAPFWIVSGLMPGASLGVYAWIRDMLAQLSAFPVAIVMFLLARIMMVSFGTGESTSNYFLPPLLGNLGEPKILGAIIGMGFIFLTPTVVTMTRDALKAPQFKYTAAIGQALGVGTKAPGMASTGLQNLAVGTPMHEGKLKGGIWEFLRMARH